MTNHSEYARNYKRGISRRFMLVDGDKILEKVSGGDFCATRKYDGVMTVIFIDAQGVRLYNSGGNEIDGTLPCVAELAQTLGALGISQGILAGELYATIAADGRERVCDVSKALADAALHAQLRLALFDLVELNGREPEFAHYKEKLAMLKRLFGAGNLVRPVAGKALDSKHSVAELFASVVTERGAEGLVVHNEAGMVYKIKPRHTIDGVVIGYTCGEDTRAAMVRDLLVAVKEPDGALRQVASVGTGIADAQRAELYARLQAMHCPSEYVDTDSRNVAFRMVRPEIVVEISAVDYVTENSIGEPKENMLLVHDATGYQPLGKTPGVVLHSPVFVRERTDKEDVAVKQLTDLCEFVAAKVTSYGHLPASTVIARHRFVKVQRGVARVQKFVVWKTNKEALDPRFPAYVLHHTDYNYERTDPLRRDIRVSSSLDQINALLDDMILANIKKGWEEIA